MRISSLNLSIAGLDVTKVELGNWYKTVRLLGVPEEIINKGIAAIREWASNNFVRIPPVPKEMQRISQAYEEKLNLEKQKQLHRVFEKDKKLDDYDSKLLRMGISPEIVARGGIAVKNYAAEHGITLPAGEGRNGLNIFA